MKAVRYTLIALTILTGISLYRTRTESIIRAVNKKTSTTGKSSLLV